MPYCKKCGNFFKHNDRKKENSVSYCRQCRNTDLTKTENNKKDSALVMMWYIAIISLCVVLLSLSTFAMYGGESEDVRLRYCDNATVLINGSSPIDDGEYAISSCTKHDMTYWTCNCTDAQTFTIGFANNALNNYSFLFVYDYDRNIGGSKKRHYTYSYTYTTNRTIKYTNNTNMTNITVVPVPLPVVPIPPTQTIPAPTPTPPNPPVSIVEVTDGFVNQTELDAQASQSFWVWFFIILAILIVFGGFLIWKYT